MPESHPDTLICLGVVIGAIGVRGEVRVKTFTESIQSLAAYGPLFAGTGGKSFVVRGLRSVKGGAGVRLEGIEDRDVALALKGTELCVPRGALTAVEDDDTFYHVDLIGLEVRDEAGNRVGSVKDVLDFGAGDLLEVAYDDGGDELISFRAETVPVVDIEAGYVVINPPVMTGEDPSA